MIADKHMNSNDNFYQYYEIENGNEEEHPYFSDALQVGATALIFKIMDELKISELLEYIHGETDVALIKELISYIYLFMQKCKL